MAFNNNSDGGIVATTIGTCSSNRGSDDGGPNLNGIIKKKRHPLNGTDIGNNSLNPALSLKKSVSFESPGEGVSASSSKSKKIVIAILIFLIGYCAGSMLAVFHLVVNKDFIDTKGTSRSEPEVTMINSNNNSSHQFESRDPFENGAPPVIGTYIHLKAPTNHESDSFVEAVYALPPSFSYGTARSSSSSSSSSTIKIALLFHACTHNALKFFSPSYPNCPECIGLSEELEISRQLLFKHQYIVLALTSKDERTGCWSVGDDLPRVQDAVQDFIQNYVLHSNYSSNSNQPAVKIIAIGASSGGKFAAEVASNGIANNGAIVMVSDIGPKLRNKFLQPNQQKPNNILPPIYLAPMPRDRRTYDAVKNTYGVIVNATSTRTANHNANVLRIRLDEKTCVPLPVTVEYLNHRVPNMTKHMAKLVIDALVKHKHLNSDISSHSEDDDNHNYLIKNPTMSDWRDVLTEECINQHCLDRYQQEKLYKPGKSTIAKALHRAWAFHEYCSEVIPIALQYFDEPQITTSK